MLKGLTTKEVELSGVQKEANFRLEAEFHTAKTYRYGNILKGAEIVSFSQYGTSEELNEEQKGFPVLRLNEFNSFFIAQPAKYCNLISQQTYDDLQLRKDDVLICRTNGNPKLVGRSALVPKDYPYAFASYLFKIRPQRHLINSATLVTYLNSKYGRLAIEKFSMVGNQANFSPAKFNQIDVPIFSETINNLIESVVYEANALLELSENKYNKAQELLHETLNIVGWTPSNINTAIKRNEYMQIEGRWDAEYFMPKFDELKKKLSLYQNGVVPLYKIANTYRGDLISDTLYSADSSCPAYIRGADISSNVLTSNKMTYIDNAFVPENEITCKYGDVVFALIGSVGTAALVTEEFIGAYVSNNLGIIRVKDNRILPEYLHLLLTSPLIGKLLFEQQEKRTAQPKISDKDIWDFPIPLLAEDVQLELQNKVQESFRLREESKRLLEVAKRTVELAIEENEENALTYIKEHGHA